MKFLSRHEAAEMLGVSFNTIVNMQHRGDLVFAKFGRQWRISEQDIRDYYRKQVSKQIEPIGTNKNGLPIYV